MPYDPRFIGAPPVQPRSDDPMELVGVSLPADEESVREMAYTFAEEFAQLGYGEERLLKLFRTPYYAGAHQAWLALGEDEIHRIVKESLAAFGGVRFVVRSAGPPNQRDPERRRLPVLPKEA
ncbi:MAG: hypothetical protein GY719_39645 [bacterium]|nr:hypothetical protein [bacterium]